MPTATSFFSLPAGQISPRDEARFFGGLKTANDTFKRTEHGRLRQLDSWLIQQLAAAAASPRRVLDVGISSGVTTLELAAAMRDAGHPIEMTGTDRAFAARLVQVAPLCRVLAEPDGHILQYDLGGWAIQPWVRRLDYATGMIAVRALLRILLTRRVRRMVAGGMPMTLVTPRLSADAVELLESDVTVADPRLVHGFDLVRCANILNRHYFDEDALQRAVANVRSYLRGPGAWLLVVRTNGATGHDASLLRMAPDRSLDLVARYGAGSEVEELCLACPVSG